ncbi:ectoine/hydroxyectoine ABC transporter substrate-binding protein EhuB [Saccharomonospora xinjiangensis]|uniref:Ectoine/hydroxyectoine ABC transporter solute-binding protein n=1 Tax=Saccharomonospora xinjiangensis XJ-54 TaxID=882086 RepID=I0V5K9_9PSEU|nr:ectoine/hydroxyectoine ABC transporter substrate-binding protein EhuB [Saccharomonospora xinjiangensis]EID55412.1 ectoine/hydroxyectoine ABC transporter solute-binding protein [Saccharomonospora xinjiangensis XJ-54]
MKGALAVGVTATLAACTEAPQTGSQGGGNTLQRLRDAGTVRVGIAGEIPYGFTRDGEVTGESPEVAKAVFNAIGVPNVESTQVEFGQLIPGLNAGQYDMVAAGMAILPERCQQAQFSAVDYVTNTAFLVPQGNPEGINNFEDVKAKGVNLAVLSGTIEQQVAESLGITNVQTFGGQAEMLQAIQADRAYAGALTDISLRALLEQNPNAKLEVTDGFVPVVDGEEQLQAGGFVFRKGDTDLVNAFNEELRKLHENGQWLEIVRPFGFTEDNLPPADVTTEQLCSGE